MSKWGLDHEFEQNPIERILSVKDRWKQIFWNATV